MSWYRRQYMLWDQNRTWKFENIYYVNLDLKLKHTKVLEIGAFHDFGTKTGVG
jgi:hypothetical protein